MFKVTKLDGTQCLFKKSDVSSVEMTAEGHTLITFQNGSNVAVKEYFDAVAADIGFEENKQ